MNEEQTSTEVVGVSTGADVDAQVAAVTAGTMLRRAREAAGVHVTTLAAAIKISVKKLEALEADKFDPLLEAVFVRALASSVCRVLKIDPAPVLEKLPQNRVPRLNAGEVGINAPFHAPGQASSLFAHPYFTKPAFFAVLALLVAVAVIVFSPQTQVTETGTSGAESVSTVSSARSAAGSVVVSKNEVIGTIKPAGAQGAVVPAPVAITSARVSDPVATLDVVVPPHSSPAPTVPRVVSNEPASVPVNMVPRNAVVVFKAKGASWVEVIDAAGVVQLRRNLAVGDAVGASGVLPLAVVVGRADLLDVQVRGKAFDLTSLSSGSVARFEVK